MPTRNPNSSFSLDSTSETPLNNSASERPRRKKIVRIPINDDGTIDASRVTSNADLEVARNAFGIAAAPPPPEVPKAKFNRDFIPPMYGLLEVVIKKAGHYLLKWPDDLTAEMYFSPEKKAALIEPTGQVIDKYSPPWLTENAEVAALACALTDAVNDMVEKGVERWVTKVKAGQQNPPPPVPSVTAPSSAAVN